MTRYVDAPFCVCLYSATRLLSASDGGGTCASVRSPLLKELGGDPEALRRIGTAVEEISYDHLFIYDHVGGVQHADREPALAGPYTEH